MKKGQWAVPVLIVVLGATGALLLVRQDRAVKVNDQGVPVQAAPGPERLPASAFPATGPGQPVQVPGGVIRSLDKINAAAARVGCDPLRPDDPAGKLLDVAECLGEKAVKSAPGQK